MRAARVDRNQVEITRALRAAGATVVSLASVGAGVPDLAVGKSGKNYFIEVKDGSKPPSGRKLTQPQEKFHASWKGSAHVVKSVEEALRVLDNDKPKCEACGAPKALESWSWCTDCRQVFREDRILMHAAVVFARRLAARGGIVQPSSIAVRFGLPLHDYEIDDVCFAGLAYRLIDADILEGDMLEQWQEATEEARLAAGRRPRIATKSSL